MFVDEHATIAAFRGRRGIAWGDRDPPRADAGWSVSMTSGSIASRCPPEPGSTSSKGPTAG